MRIAGLILMTAAPVLLSLRAAAHYRKGQRQVDEFIALIEELRTKIRYYKLPLGEIFASMHCRDLSVFCRDLADMHFSEALEKNRTGFFFGEECFERLVLFAFALGKSGCEDQVQNCDLALEALKKERDRLSVEAPKQMKVVLSLGCMSGALLLLLFL